jgi:hypothetical protein
MRFAFYGRVSTEGAQDPSLSIPRQPAACQRIIGDGGGELVARYWDIESGRKSLAARGNGASGDRFGVAVSRATAASTTSSTPQPGRRSTP